MMGFPQLLQQLWRQLLCQKWTPEVGVGGEGLFQSEGCEEQIYVVQRGGNRPFFHQ